MKYNADFYGWTQEQAAALRSGSLSRLDVDHLLEEIEDMGNSQIRALTTRLKVLMMHLLKHKHQPSHRGKSWELTIKEQRRQILKLLDKNPSMKSKLAEILEDAYDDARHEAELETGLALATFPVKCEWTFDQLTDSEFYPD